MRSALAPTASSSTLSSSSAERRMRPTTSPAATTPLGRRSWICAWTASGSWQTTVPASRASWSSMRLVEGQGLDLDPCFSSGSRSITARSRNWASPSILRLKCPLLSSSPTTASSQPTPSLSTLTSQCSWTTRRSMTSAAALLTLSAPPTPTSIASSLSEPCA
ncbi:hypothetical protein MUK42_37695 [Musa troglodytarum]|uniref:Uncharacterized protein n=1 Tax=Musa troglodytarum TaxID=320322 RepID=A0A9E7KD81_9LILI|nr:hypothetical protein MUK42_12831 [Musa troglodytarum]URE21174.1 hypothetical protein MUK42_37695 [Musa troglodytarum]